MVYAPQSSFIERAVIWYKKTSDSILSKVIAVAAAIFFSLLLVTIPLIINFTTILIRKRKAEAFYKDVANKVPPPIEGHIEVDTKTQSFNHVSSYVIHDDIIWYKRRVDDYNQPINYDWKPIFFDTRSSIRPIELKVDGANLIVIDNFGEVHYKKIIKEKFNEKEHYYSIHDKSDKDNWKDKWFSLPILNRIVNIFTGKKLHLPKFTKAFGIAHRGQYNHYIEDGKMNKHSVRSGITTLYILHKDGRYIYLYDPWKPKNVIIRIPIPGTTESPFIAENINVSGSTIMVIGYRYIKKIDGTVYKKPEVMTMIADVDSLSWNPAFKYTYFDHQDPEYRVMPTEKGFMNHVLPSGEITSGITILQTGEGNQTREMRIVGKNKQGVPGYWHKMLTDKKWKFAANMTNDAYEDEYKDKVMIKQESEDMPDPIVFNWNDVDYELSLENFNNECVTGKLRAGNVKLLLHRKENIIVKILTNGKELHHYDLVLPEGVDRHDLPVDLQGFFKKRRVIRVKIMESGKGLLTIKEVGANIPNLNLNLDLMKK
jgi:hypothetical protein